MKPYDPVTLRTPDEWLLTENWKGITVLDPDGWDRKNFSVSWSTPITEQEFSDRIAQSTCQFPQNFFKNL